MLLAEELALLAIDPESGRHALGTRDALNACLAGLLIAELALPHEATSPVIGAARAVLDEKHGKVKAALSNMDRGLRHRIGTGTWDSIVGGLVATGILGESDGGMRPRHAVLDTTARDELVERIRAAAAADDQMDVRTAMVLSMTGPAQLLELVAPDRSTRKHARNRIDHGLEHTDLAEVGAAVRKVLADAQAAAIGAATVAAVSGAVSAS
jgi:hypothetical protein